MWVKKRSITNPAGRAVKKLRSILSGTAGLRSASAGPPHSAEKTRGCSGSLFLCRLFFVEKRLHKQIVDRFQLLV